MIDLSFIQFLGEMGFQPTELLVLALLWQNVKSARALLDRLITKVERLEVAVAYEASSN